MEEFIFDAFGEILVHWCHPHGDDAHLYMTTDEYNKAAMDYFDKISKDDKKFEEEWGETLDDMMIDVNEKFGDTKRDQVKKIMMDCLEEHLLL